MRTVDDVATLLLIVGAVNWGLIGLARFDLVAELFGLRFGETSGPVWVIYTLVGVAGLYRALVWKGVGAHATLAAR